MKKIYNIMFSLILSTAIFLGTATTANAAPILMADGNFFDAQYYAQNNPDVVAVLGLNASVLYAHYTNHGMSEGRTPYDPSIDIGSLIELNAYAATVDSTLRTSDSSYLELKSALPGSYVTFGAYEQDNNYKNGQEPIEWLVLENDGESLFVISKYVLDGQLYSNAYGEYTWQPHPVTWETCSLRFWLNNTFLQSAFTPAEQERINTTLVDNSLPEDYLTFPGEEPVTGGNHTYDKIYIPSYNEIIKYFAMQDTWLSSFGTPVSYDKHLRAVATPYAVSQGVAVWTEKVAADCLAYGGGYKNIATEVIGYVQHWALRTPYGAQTCIYNVGASGSFGYRTVSYDNATRPCMRISIN